MTTETMLDRRLRELMAELAAPGDQSAAIDNVISVTRALRPEPRWRALLKERPMRTSSIVIAGSPPLRFGLIFAVVALIGLLAVTAVVGALVLQQTALPPAYGPAANGALAYAASGDIVTTDAARADVTAITTGPAIDSRPAYSRDGTRIAFVRKAPASATEQLMVADADGTELVAITPEMLENPGVRLVPERRPHRCAGRHHQWPGLRPSLSWPHMGMDRPNQSTSASSRRASGLGWRPPDGDELIFRANPTPGDPAAGLYAVDLAGRRCPDPSWCPPTRSRTIRRSWHPSSRPMGGASRSGHGVRTTAGEVSGWGACARPDSGTERMASTWGGSTSPISPDGRWVAGADVQRPRDRVR